MMNCPKPCLSKQHILFCSLLAIFCTSFLTSNFADAQSNGFVTTDKDIYIASGYDPITVKIEGSFDPSESIGSVTIYISHDGKSERVRDVNIDSGKFNKIITLDPKKKDIFGIYEILVFYGGPNKLVRTFEVTNKLDSPPPSPSPPPPPPNIPPSVDDLNIDSGQLSGIVVETDFPVYNTGDEVVVSVDILSFIPPGFNVAFQVFSPNNNIIEIAEVTPDNNGEVSKSFRTGKQFYKENGIYTVKIFYNSLPRIEAETTFEMVNPAPPPPPPPPPQIHKRAFIEVYGFGNVFDFGLSKFQHRHVDIQFENNNGRTIHIYKDGKTVRDLFDSLNIGITAQCFTDMDSGRDFCSDSMHELRFSINGNNIMVVSDHVLEDGDLIKIEYEQLATNPPPINPIPAPQPPPIIPDPQQSPSSAGQSIDPIWIAVLLVITGVITAIIVAVNRINKKPKKPKPKQSRIKQVKPRGPATVPTVLFYECPQCHNPDISNNSDGTATCAACGFKN